MCSSECEEGYYSFLGQELWRYFKEKGKKHKIVSVCYLSLCLPWGQVYIIIIDD